MKYSTRFICFVGIDGSGKSSLAQKLVDELKADGNEVSYLWLRMNYLFTKPLLLLCRIIGITKRPVFNGQKISIHEFYRAPFLAQLVRIMHTFDTLLHFYIKIYFPLKFTNKIIVCDRFLYDVFVDFAVEGKKYDIFDSLLFKLSKKIMLGEATSFLILVNKDIILKRRPSVLDFDFTFDERFKLYNDLKNSPNIICVDNNHSFEIAYSEVRKKIINE